VVGVEHRIIITESSAENENPLTNIETRMSFLKPDFSLRPPPTFFDGWSLVLCYELCSRVNRGRQKKTKKRSRLRRRRRRRGRRRRGWKRKSEKVNNILNGSSSSSPSALLPSNEI